MIFLIRLHHYLISGQVFLIGLLLATFNLNQYLSHFVNGSEDGLIVRYSEWSIGNEKRREDLECPSSQFLRCRRTRLIRISDEIEELQE